MEAAFVKTLSSFTDCVVGRAVLLVVEALTETNKVSFVNINVEKAVKDTESDKDEREDD